MSKTKHISVMLREIVEYLNLSPGDNVIDCTFGGGGHSLEILKQIGKDGKLLAIDLNEDVRKEIGNWKLEIKKNKNFKLVNDNFKNLKNIVNKDFKYPVNGILLDLGLSSDELEKSGRGFSFQKDEPLDMRFDVNQDLTAEHVLNSYSVEELYNIFKDFGEYSHARRLSKSVYQQRKLKKFKNTQDLVDIVLEVHPHKYYNKIHPATKIFQALRIAVNNELENLKKVLPQAVEILQSRGRLVVISFHALEDRIVKHYFRELSRKENSKIKLLTKKPISPSEKEVEENPRSRSAKMRVVEKI